MPSYRKLFKRKRTYPTRSPSPSRKRLRAESPHTSPTHSIDTPLHPLLSSRVPKRKTPPPAETPSTLKRLRTLSWTTLSYPPLIGSHSLQASTNGSNSGGLPLNAGGSHDVVALSPNAIQAVGSSPPLGSTPSTPVSEDLELASISTDMSGSFSDDSQFDQLFDSEDSIEGDAVVDPRLSVATYADQGTQTDANPEIMHFGHSANYPSIRIYDFPQNVQLDITALRAAAEAAEDARKSSL
ncbi:hypothetical protein PLICRDRAFT_28805 [Plicaturopsis crispa FD-325 SS-3]|nr:hypothetical protein PLICRDRAFT_28805 [Plicaturopsis crispa FD-325 SS-3]